MILGFYHEEMIGLSDCPFYCPQNTTGFYVLDFNLNLSLTLVNYCPQNTAEFYTISYTENNTFDLTSYCQQTTTNFYTFDNPP